MGENLQELLDKFAPEVQAIALTAREHILDLIPEAQEKVYLGYNAVNYGLSAGMKGAFVSLVLHRAHVNLQFSQGAHLPDPGGLLEGTGKSMRHVKLREVDTVRKDEVSELIKIAAERARTET
jgi:hypothetical protein